MCLFSLKNTSDTESPLLGYVASLSLLSKMEASGTFLCTLQDCAENQTRPFENFQQLLCYPVYFLPFSPLNILMIAELVPFSIGEI